MLAFSPYNTLISQPFISFPNTLISYANFQQTPEHRKISTTIGIFTSIDRYLRIADIFVTFDL